MKILLSLIAVALAALVLLVSLRISDLRADRALRRQLLNRPDEPVPLMTDAMLRGLPEPAARFFSFAIAPGTPLLTIAKIDMIGELSLGTKDDPGYEPMVAEQVLAPPSGFLWQVKLRTAAGVTGSDAFTGTDSWSRFRLLDLIPVGRVAHDPDHRLSSFGRMVGEGLFWTPAAFLSEAGAGWDRVEWELVSANIAAVRVQLAGLEQRAELTVDPDGRPLRVVFQRWSNENADRVYRFQPFGGELSDFENFGGFTLPTRVVGGNHFGTSSYHPFFKARDVKISYP